MPPNQDEYAHFLATSWQVYNMPACQIKLMSFVPISIPNQVPHALGLQLQQRVLSAQLIDTWHSPITFWINVQEVNYVPDFFIKKIKLIRLHHKNN